MDFPLSDLMDETACYERLLAWLHPGGLACPRCRDREHLQVHRRHRDPILDWRCSKCGRVFNLFTGTAFQKTRRPCSQLLLFVRGVAQGQSTAALARELGCSRPHLLKLRHKLQERAAGQSPPQPLAGRILELDEMYQNSGEKRRSAPRSRRPAAKTRPPVQRPRHLGQRPSAGAGRRQPR